MRERFAEDRRIEVIHKPYNAARLQAALEDLRARSRAGFNDSTLALPQGRP
jgi:hypothetical protein